MVSAGVGSKAAVVEEARLSSAHLRIPLHAMMAPR